MTGYPLTSFMALNGNKEISGDNGTVSSRLGTIGSIDIPSGELVFVNDPSSTFSESEELKCITTPEGTFDLIGTEITFKNEYTGEALTFLGYASILFDKDYYFSGGSTQVVRYMIIPNVDGGTLIREYAEKIPMVGVNSKYLNIIDKSFVEELKHMIKDEGEATAEYISKLFASSKDDGEAFINSFPSTGREYAKFALQDILAPNKFMTTVVADYTPAGRMIGLHFDLGTIFVLKNLETRMSIEKSFEASYYDDNEILADLEFQPAGIEETDAQKHRAYPYATFKPLYNGETKYHSGTIEHTLISDVSLLGSISLTSGKLAVYDDRSRLHDGIGPNILTPSGEFDVYMTELQLETRKDEKIVSMHGRTPAYLSIIFDKSLYVTAEGRMTVPASMERYPLVPNMEGGELITKAERLPPMITSSDGFLLAVDASALITYKQMIAQHSKAGQHKLREDITKLTEPIGDYFTDSTMARIPYGDGQGEVLEIITMQLQDMVGAGKMFMPVADYLNGKMTALHIDAGAAALLYKLEGRG